MRPLNNSMEAHSQNMELITVDDKTDNPFLRILVFQPESALLQLASYASRPRGSRILQCLKAGNEGKVTMYNSFSDTMSLLTS